MQSTSPPLAVAKTMAVKPKETIATTRAANIKTAALGKTKTVTPFDQANRLLREGLNEAEVARRCGLSKSEAAVMAMLIRQQQAALA